MASRKRVHSTPRRSSPVSPARLPEPEPARDPWIGARILPLRVFLGVTFLYAGLVKLLDPSFFDPTAPTSLAVQLQGFARDLPLALLITLVAIPLATPIGVLVALSEVAVGLGALTGLAGRAAAMGGCAIALLFWLTASWAIKPYFYGPDLPYAAGWLTSLSSGTAGGTSAAGDRSRLPSARRVGALVRGRIVVSRAPIGDRGYRPRSRLSGHRGALSVRDGFATRWSDPSCRARVRLPVEASLVVDPAGNGSRAAGASTGPTASGQSATAPPATAGARGPVIGRVRTVDAAGSSSFTVPGTGDPGVIVKLADGSFVAFDATCTHAGCPVQYVPQDQALECPCHGAAFDPAHHGAVLGGPTNTPLTELPIAVDHAAGVIRLTA